MNLLKRGAFGALIFGVGLMGAAAAQASEAGKPPARKTPTDRLILETYAFPESVTQRVEVRFSEKPAFPKSGVDYVDRVLSLALSERRSSPQETDKVDVVELMLDGRDGKGSQALATVELAIFNLNHVEFSRWFCTEELGVDQRCVVRFSVEGRYAVDGRKDFIVHRCNIAIKSLDEAERQCTEG